MKLTIALFILFSNSLARASSLQIATLRLSPGQDVKMELDKYIRERKVLAASILSAVGSLRKANLRFADKKDATLLPGPFEIVGLSGTTGIDGSHFHMVISDGQGKTLGGHLVEGNIVYTTLELVLGIYPELHFKRTMDPKSGYNELDVQKRP